MKKRHFLVREEDSDFMLKEIAPEIGHAIGEFGATTGSCHTVESVRWFFYFMHCKFAPHRADEIAQQLTEEFLRGERSEYY